MEKELLKSKLEKICLNTLNEELRDELDELGWYRDAPDEEVIESNFPEHAPSTIQFLLEDTEGSRLWKETVDLYKSISSEGVKDSLVNNLVKISSSVGLPDAVHKIIDYLDWRKEDHVAFDARMLSELAGVAADVPSRKSTAEYIGQVIDYYDAYSAFDERDVVQDKVRTVVEINTQLLERGASLDELASEIFTIAEEGLSYLDGEEESLGGDATDGKECYDSTGYEPELDLEDDINTAESEPDEDLDFVIDSEPASPGSELDEEYWVGEYGEEVWKFVDDLQGNAQKLVSQLLKETAENVELSDVVLEATEYLEELNLSDCTVAAGLFRDLSEHIKGRYAAGPNEVISTFHTYADAITGCGKRCGFNLLHDVNKLFLKKMRVIDDKWLCSLSEFQEITRNFYRLFDPEVLERVGCENNEYLPLAYLEVVEELGQSDASEVKGSQLVAACERLAEEDRGGTDGRYTKDSKRPLKVVRPTYSD